MSPRNWTGILAGKGLHLPRLDWRKAIVVHPFLFAIYPILFLYAHNIHLTVLNEALVPMAIATGCAVLFFSLLSLILKDKERAGLLVSLFVLLFFSYGHFSDPMEGFRIVAGKFIIGPNQVLIPTWGIFFGLGVFFLVRTRRNLRTVTNFLNIAAASLAVISLGKILSYEIGTPRPVMRSSENVDTSQWT